MTIEEAKKLDHFVCSECSSDDDMKKPQATFSASPGADGKVISNIQYEIITTLFSLLIVHGIRLTHNFPLFSFPLALICGG